MFETGACMCICVFCVFLHYSGQLSTFLHSPSVSGRENHTEANKKFVLCLYNSETYQYQS